MRGRPKKPTEIKKLQGTEDKRWLVENEMKVLPLDEIPMAPDGFDEETQQIWATVCRELQRNNLLAGCDLELLHGYCTLLRQYYLATEKLKKEGTVILSRHGDKVANPWYHIQGQSLKQATQIAQLFGITPSARSRISSGTTKPTSKLEQLKKPKTA
jgi:P27 family predicted phage terminase small subunit